MLVAGDAFNGVLFWNEQTGSWENQSQPFRGGPAEPPGYLVAVGEHG